MSSVHIDGLSPALDRIADALEAIADPPDRSNAAMASALKACREALEMVRDADDDARLDGLPTMPEMARAKIDAALVLP